MAIYRIRLLTNLKTISFHSNKVNSTLGPNSVKTSASLITHRKRKLRKLQVHGLVLTGPVESLLILLLINHFYSLKNRKVLSLFPLPTPFDSTSACFLRASMVVFRSFSLEITEVVMLQDMVAILESEFMFNFLSSLSYLIRLLIV